MFWDCRGIGDWSYLLTNIQDVTDAKNGVWKNGMKEKIIVGRTEWAPHKNVKMSAAFKIELLLPIYVHQNLTDEILCNPEFTLKSNMNKKIVHISN